MILATPKLRVIRGCYGRLLAFVLENDASLMVTYSQDTTSLAQKRTNGADGFHDAVVAVVRGRGRGSGGVGAAETGGGGGEAARKKAAATTATKAASRIIFFFFFAVKVRGDC